MTATYSQKPNSYNLKPRQGFTLVEFILVMGFSAILISFITASLIRPETQTDLDGEILKVMTDLKSQQLKAMAGVTNATDDPVSYGINFATTSYVLFRGSSYNPADALNFTVSFPSSIQLSAIGFSSGTVIFSRLTGLVSGYAAGQDYITMQNTISSATGTVTINRFGALTKTP